MNENTLSPYFLGILVIIGIISFFFFFLGKDAKLKRKYFAPFIIGSGVLFVIFWAFSTGFRRELILVVPFVILSIYMNIRITKFCDSCGKTNMSQNLVSKPKFCSNCGNALKH